MSIFVQTFLHQDILIFKQHLTEKQNTKIYSLNLSKIIPAPTRNKSIQNIY